METTEGNGNGGKAMQRTANAGIGVTAAIVLVWIFETQTGTKVPSEVAGAFGVLCSSVAGIVISRWGHKCGL